MQKSLKQIQLHATFSGTGVMESENHSEKNGISMKNRFKNGLLSAVFLFVLVSASFAQDIIVTRDSKKITAQVMEVNIDNVRYKNFDNPDGPVYTILKSDIVTILYQNGQLETFAAESQGASKSEKSSVPKKPTPEYFYYVENNPVLLLNEMEKNNNKLYMDYMYGERKAKTGNTFLWIGIPISVAGILLTASEDFALVVIGVPSSVVGQGFIGLGLTYKFIGNGQKNRAVKDYCKQQSYTMQPKPYFKLNMSLNRVGLAYVF